MGRDGSGPCGWDAEAEGQRRTGWRPWKQSRTFTSQHGSGSQGGDGFSPQPSQGQGRANRDPRNRTVLNERKSLMSRQIALCLQTQDGGERRGWRGGYKGGRDGYKRSDWTNTDVPGSDSDSFMFVVGLVVGGKITQRCLVWF